MYVNVYQLYSCVCACIYVEHEKVDLGEDHFCIYIYMCVCASVYHQQMSQMQLHTCDCDMRLPDSLWQKYMS